MMGLIGRGRRVEDIKEENKIIIKKVSLNTHTHTHTHTHILSYFGV